MRRLASRNHVGIIDFYEFPIAGWYHGVPKSMFLLYTAYKSKNMSNLCYEKFTKFENVFKIGPEPMFYIF